jgi:hypothetical protein
LPSFFAERGNTRDRRRLGRKSRGLPREERMEDFAVRDRHSGNHYSS